MPEPGNPQSLNRYAYVLNNPLRYTDPTGHWLESLIDIISIGYDLYDISQHGLTWENGLSLVADVASLALPVVTGGGMMVRAVAHADDMADVARGVNAAVNVAQAANQADNVVDAGVAAYRAHRGPGIHPASTGKAFLDWFKANILKNPAAKGKKILDGTRRLDIVDDAGTLVHDGSKQIYELKNYTPETPIGQAFRDQASAYLEYARKHNYTLNYVFGQKIGNDVARWLIVRGIKVWYIDDAGQMIEWIVR